MHIQPAEAPDRSLHVITLGEFSSDLAPLAPRLAALKIEATCCITPAQLPAALTRHDVLLTELTWLSGLTAAERDDLSRRAALAARWIVLAGADASFEEQIARA